MCLSDKIYVDKGWELLKNKEWWDFMKNTKKFKLLLINLGMGCAGSNAMGLNTGKTCSSK